MEIKLFKTKKNFKKKNLDLHPHLYWKILVGFIFLATLASLAFGRYKFMAIQEETFDTNGSPRSTEPVEQERLQKAIEYFSSRAEKSKEIINSPSPVVDPS